MLRLVQRYAVVPYLGIGPPKFRSFQDRCRGHNRGAEIDVFPINDIRDMMYSWINENIVLQIGRCNIVRIPRCRCLRRIVG